MSVLDPRDLEPELEALLERWVPQMSRRWSSASPADIEAIERIAGTELPRCYRWLLQRLGGGFSEVAYSTLDFSAHAVASGYSRGAFAPYEGMICIAEDNADWQPQRRYYDLAHPTEDDAPVYMAGPEQEDFAQEFETLRELIGSGAFNNFRLAPMAYRCAGLIVAEDESDVLRLATPLLEGIGFVRPIRCGPMCLLYDNGTVAFSSYRNPERREQSVVPFRMGASEEALLRATIGVIAASDGLRVKNVEWKS